MSRNERPAAEIGPQRDLQIVVQDSRNITTQTPNVAKALALNIGAQILAVSPHLRKKVAAFYAGL